MEIIKGTKVALVFGATGLIGQHLVQQLLAHQAYEKVKVFVRRKMNIAHDKLEQYLVDFDNLLDYGDLIEGDDLYCALGTTRAKAGSKEAFFKVDFTYVYEAARIGMAQGVNQLLLVSSVGADPNSMFYYSQVKGEIEKAVKQLDYWAIHIFQPSLLLGERNENRFGEEVAKKIGGFIDKLTGNLLTKYSPIEAEAVAQAMIAAAQRLDSGIHTYKSEELQELAEEYFKYGKRLKIGNANKDNDLQR